MSKITIAVLTLAAFLYAAWLVFLRKPLPDPVNATGLRKRFLLAVLLFAGLLGASASADETKTPVILCYSPAPPAREEAADTDPSYRREVIPVRRMSRDEVVATLKGVWRTLDPAKADEFRAKLFVAADSGAIRQKVAAMLQVAFEEVSRHKVRTRDEGIQADCYYMSALGPQLIQSWENALKQLELLDEAREKGAIDAETAAKARDALAREVEMLERTREFEALPRSWPETERFAKDYEDGKIVPGDAAEVAASMIVRMEDGPDTALSPEERLAGMKRRVDALFRRGPESDDWEDPGIRPNLSAVLEEAGVLERTHLEISCYKRVASPVEARSEELKKLQQDLLDRSVRAGVLDAETAEKAAAAAGREETDYAPEDSIRDFQENVRRITRLLYEHGELPSGFVEEVENAVDLDIIDFDPSRAIRNDVAYHLGSILWDPRGRRVMKSLEERELIPPARNHRWEFRYLRRSGLSEEEQERISRFEDMIDGKAELSLPGDSEVTVSEDSIPEEDREYRLRMRTICRALVATGLAADVKRIVIMEEILGIPLVGRIEGG